MCPTKQVLNIVVPLTTVSLLGAMPAAGMVSEFLMQSDISLGFRLRYEQAQDDLKKDGEALTLRTLLGWQSGAIDGIGAFVEIEDTRAIGGANYSDGLTERGTVLIADPVGTDINQAYLQYATPWGLTTTLGRQAITLGDERFVGTVGFRQNNQSYDALSLRYQSQSRHTLYYGYVDNVNRVFGNDADDVPALRLGDHDHNTHLLNLTFTLDDWGTLESYGYMIDNQDLPRVSTNTLGIRLKASHKPAQFTYLYDLAFAHQSDTGNNPADYSANYWHVNTGIAYKRLSLQLSQERLGSGDEYGFVTPLATMHKFQGWADKFVARTPGEGLIDSSITLGGRWPGFRYRIRYHDFKTDVDTIPIGTEWNVQVQRKFGQAYLLELKYADYRGRTSADDLAIPGDLARNTRRLFLTFIASF